MSTTDTAQTADLVARYAREFNATYASEHAVTSPLGAWLLLAIAAPAARGDVRDRLEVVLGCGAEDAAARAAAILGSGHPAVAAAAAVWARARFMTDDYTGYAAGLPGAVEQGDVPTQATADRWAAGHTGGMIPEFPIAVTADTALVLATAVATDVSWREPFGTAPAADLGGDFGGSITTALVAAAGHDQFLADTAAAGRVAAHVAASTNGLAVVSVIAAPDVAAADAHAAAHEVGALAAGLRSTATRRSLFDVPLGPGHAWTVTETVEERFGGPPRVETHDTLLPAWSATGDHDVLSAAGFPELGATFTRFLRAEYLPATFEAKQAAVATYSRAGFKAAAVTAFGMRAGSAAPRPVTVTRRHAAIRFNRRFAAVAVASDAIVDDGGSRRLDPQWAGLPVFSTWITRPDDTPAEGS